MAIRGLDPFVVVLDRVLYGEAKALVEIDRFCVGSLYV